MCEKKIIHVIIFQEDTNSYVLNYAKIKGPINPHF